MELVLYADSEMVVINKPSGLASVPIRPDDSETAVSLAFGAHPELAGVGHAVGRPLEGGLLHRLDTGTSGALAFARTPQAFGRLRKSWKDGEVGKTYRALISGEPPFPDLPFEIATPLGRSAKSSRRMIALVPGKPALLRQIRGRPLPALTRLDRARPVEWGACLKQLKDVEIRISTGVMHQIRCHLSSIGWPILGDRTYGGDASERVWLHAWKLALPTGGGRLVEIEAPLPAPWPKN